MAECLELQLGHESKKIYIVVAILIISFAGLVIFAKRTQAPRPGIAQRDNGREHVKSKDYKAPTVPPTSGAHAEPIEWGFYDVEQRDDQIIHNLEHGGVYVSYHPSLPKKDIDKMKKLLFSPFKLEKFQPKKIVLAPRAANDAPVVISSWLRNLKLESYNEKALVTYVQRNLGRSPEPLAN